MYEDWDDIRGRFDEVHFIWINWMSNCNKNDDKLRNYKFN